MLKLFEAGSMAGNSLKMLRDISNGEQISKIAPVVLVFNIFA